MSTFPDQLFHFGGIPVASNGMLPMLGGKAVAYFVDPAQGNDNNSGTRPDPQHSLDKVSIAEGKTVDKQGDVVYLLNDGNTSGSSRESAEIVWDKDNTHLIGLGAPTGISQRARIVTPASGYTGTAIPLMTFSGHGNIIANVHIGHWHNTDTIASRGVDVEGNRNYFNNVHFVGIGGANVGDEANAADLYINGGQENTFERCTIGVDTVAMSTTCSKVELVNSATRNVFIDSLFLVYDDAGNALFVKADAAADLDRFVLFRGCSFINAVESGATTMTSAVNVHDAAAGVVMFHNCQIVGASNVAAADNGNVWVDGVGGAASGGLSIVATQ